MVYKGFLVFDLLFKLGIGLTFVKKVFKARRTPGDFESFIGSKALVGALAGVVD